MLKPLALNSVLATSGDADGLEQDAISGRMEYSGLSNSSGELTSSGGVDAFVWPEDVAESAPAGAAAPQYALAAAALPVIHVPTAGFTVAAFEHLIKTAAAGTVFQLAAGRYEFTDTLDINRSDITIKGAGSGATFIDINKGPTNTTAFEIAGANARSGSESRATGIQTGPGTITLTLDKAQAIRPGSVIHVEQANDRKWLDSMGYTNVLETASPLREMLAKVISVSPDGKTLTVAAPTKPLPFQFTPEISEVSVSAPSMLRNVNVSGLTIKSRLGTADSDDFSEDNAAFSGGTFTVGNATASKFSDIKLVDNASNGFIFRTVFDISADKLTSIGAHNKGADGNGYGFFLRNGVDSKFTNLVDQDMRVGFLFGAFTAENNNIVHVLQTNRAVNFHGGPDSGNDVTVDRQITTTLDARNRAAVGTGNHEKHPLTDIFGDNKVVFRILQSGDAQDIVYGHDDGSSLDTAGAHDELHGGRGADLLNPGSGDDTMTGGLGVDTFVFRRGFHHDTVVDMQAGPAGDIIDLVGTGITSRANMSIRQIGADTVISLGGGHSLTLKDELATNSFQFKFSAPTAEDREIIAIGSDRGLTGSEGADTFVVKTGYFDDRLDLIGGKRIDTLELTGGILFDVDDVGRAAGIDIIDVRSMPSANKAKVSLDNEFVNQTDRGYVTVRIDSAGLKLDTGNITSAADVRISGAGTVKLEDKGQVVSSAGSKLNVVGGTGGDKIIGSDEADYLDGQLGGDFLTGGRGADRLFGGNDGNRDTFVYISKFDSTRKQADFIDRFDSGEDKIDLRAFDVRFSRDGEGRNKVWIDDLGSKVNVYVDSDGLKANGDWADMLIKVDIGSVNSGDFLL